MTPAALKALADGNADNFLAAAMPGGIERQEKQGQTDFVNSSTLPSDCMGTARADLEAMGVVFGEPVDDLFVNVTLPNGWKKVATSHSMHSDLVDDKGRARAGIFYKAAFYDRNAHISTRTRYSVNSYIDCDADGKPVENERGSHYQTCVTDCGQPLQVIGHSKTDDYNKSDELQREAYAWLDKNYPDHRNATAYWD